MPKNKGKLQGCLPPPFFGQGCRSRIERVACCHRKGRKEQASWYVITPLLTKLFSFIFPLADLHARMRHWTVVLKQG